jgi:hypothetical protein
MVLLYFLLSFHINVTGYNNLLILFLELDINMTCVRIGQRSHNINYIAIDPSIRSAGNYRTILQLTSVYNYFHCNQSLYIDNKLDIT